MDTDFDTVEVCHIPDANVRREAVKILAQSHMCVYYGAQPQQLAEMINPNALDEAERHRAEDMLLSALDEAEALGACGFAFMAGKWQPDSRDQALGQLIKTTRSLCARAAEKGMMVELEVFDFDMDKAVLIGPAPLALRFAGEIRCFCSNFGLLVDLSHIPTTREDSRFVIETLRPYITHLHIGNAVVKPGCEAYGDQHPRFGFPNSENDTIQLLHFLQILRDEGFFRNDDPLTLSFEVKPRDDEDANIVLASSKRVLNRAWALLDE